MKTLLGVLTLLAAIAAAVSGVAAILFLYGDSTVLGWQSSGSFPPVLGNILMALLGMSMIIGLVTAVLSALAGLPLLVLNLLARSWGWSLLSLAVSVLGGGLWLLFISKRI